MYEQLKTIRFKIFFKWTDFIYNNEFVFRIEFQKNKLKTGVFGVDDQNDNEEKMEIFCNINLK
jgi:desulfoferrodoxin (superoxide reductase-like protein)